MTEDRPRALALYDSVDVQSGSRYWTFMDGRGLLVGEWQLPGITAFLNRYEAGTVPVAAQRFRYHHLFYAFHALGRQDRAAGILADLERATGEPHPLMRILGSLYGGFPDSVAAPDLAG